MATPWRILVGRGAGLLAAWALLASAAALSPRARASFVGALLLAAHPAAWLLAAIARRPLEAEMSIAFHLAGIYATFALAGAAIALFWPART